MTIEKPLPSNTDTNEIEPVKPRFVGGRETVRLSEIAKIKAGNVAPKKDAFTEDGIPFVRAGSLTNLLAGGSLADLEKIDGGTAQKLRLTLFPAGTVVFAKSGMSCMTGNVYVLPKPCYVVSHLACVIPNGNYASYLKHYFRFNRPNRLIENPSFPSIKLSKIQGIELKLPSPEKGVRQVQALERIESQIGRATTLLTYLNSLVKSRFVEMFGDPCGPGSSSGKSRVDSFCELRIGPFGSALHKEDYITGGHPLVNPSHIVGDKIKPDKNLTIDDEKYESLAAYHLLPGDVVLGRRGEIGRCAVVKTDGLICGTGSMIIRPGQKVRSDYLQRVVSFPSFSHALETNAVGVTMKNLNAKIVGSAEVFLPGLNEQDAFISFIHQVDKLRFKTQQQIEKLEMLKESLMQEYFG